MCDGVCMWYHITCLLCILHSHQYLSFSKSKANPYISPSLHVFLFLGTQPCSALTSYKSSLPQLYLSPFFCLPSFKISSLPPQSLIPANCASSGLCIIIFLNCPGVSDTVGSFHLETCFAKPLLYLFLLSLLLPLWTLLLGFSHSFFSLCPLNVCSQTFILSFLIFPSISSFRYFICFPNCNCH